MSYSIKVKSSPENKRAFQRAETIRARTEEAIRRAWFDIGDDFKSEARSEVMRKPKGGRVYTVRTRGSRARRHVSSAAKETHANLTGALRDSIGYAVRGHESMTFGYGVGAKQQAPDYASSIEFGRKGVSPRPSLSNAIDAMQRNVEMHFSRAIIKGLGK